MDRAQRALLITASLCAFFAVGLLFLAIHFHSVAFLAGGLLTVSRTITGFLVALGIHLSGKRTSRFRAGLYKIENLIVMAIGILIMAGAYVLGKTAVAQALSQRPFITEPSKAIPTLIFAAIFALANALYKSRVARKELCPSLMADSRHSFVDAIAMFLIALGVVISAAGIPVADLAAALIVAVIAGISGGRIAIDGIKVLLDASIERDVLDSIRRIVADDPRVREISEISGRNSGSYRFLFLRLVPYTFDVLTNTAISDYIRQSIREKYPNIDEISIEYVPEMSDMKNITVPVSGGVFFTDDVFRADDFVILDADLTNRTIRSKRVVKNRYPGGDLRDNIRLVVELTNEGTDILVFASSQPESDAMITLNAYGIDTVPWKTDGKPDDVESIALGAVDSWKGRLVT